MFGVNLSADAIPGAVVERRGAPEEDHRLALQRGHVGIAQARLIEGFQLLHHVIDAPEVGRLEHDARREALVHDVLHRQVGAILVTQPVDHKGVDASSPSLADRV